MNKKKARLCTALFSIMLLGILVDVGIVWPHAIPYILAPFAVTGAFKFVRVLYIWFITDPAEKRMQEEMETW